MVQWSRSRFVMGWPSEGVIATCAYALCFVVVIFRNWKFFSFLFSSQSFSSRSLWKFERDSLLHTFSYVALGKIQYRICVNFPHRVYLLRHHEWKSRLAGKFLHLYGFGVFGYWLGIGKSNIFLGSWIFENISNELQNNGELVFADAYAKSGQSFRTCFRHESLGSSLGKANDFSKNAG